MKNSFLNGLFVLLLLLFSCKKEDQDWPVYLGDKASSQYKSLDQINVENVGKLELAWEYETGDTNPEEGSQIQCNPIIVGNTLYASSPRLKVFALDASTGENKWTFDPAYKGMLWLNTNRGVTYWKENSDERILFTAGPWLFALNAKTGKPVETFGEMGKVSLKSGLGEVSGDLSVVSTTPGVIFGNLLIIGTRVSESAQAAPGHIRAFDVKTGAVVWTFHTIPYPGEFGYETWPEDAWTRIGGANSWAGLSLDEELEMVYVPTGSASFDFWGGDRKGENLFANCILALDANTGERKWHFQTVHHDLWDRDLPCPPNLVTIVKEGRKIPALTQATKSGFLYVLNRVTGEPLFPVEEQPVPPSDLAGEEAWPTQPFPTQPPPFSRQVFGEEDINTIFPEYIDSIRHLVLNTRGGQQYIPPSTEGTMYFPGFDGGAEWGGQAFDPESGLLYVNANEMPWIQTMVLLEEEKIPEMDLLAEVGESLYKVNCMVCHGKELNGDATGTYPSLRGLSDRRNRSEIMEIIVNGKGFMTGFAYLSDDEREAVMAYILEDKTPITDAHSFDLEKNRNRVPYSHTGYNRFVLPNGYPAVKPPWGTLSAIDVSEGSIKWQVPLGEFEELTELGIPKTGTENYGGPVVTAGGLVFIGASKDEYFRAFDKTTGEELWKYKLPAGGYATPSTYMIDGKQYVVIACGGGKMGTKSGGKYVAFALPEN